jgi:cytochrome c-type biogenesis protein CcmE
MDLAPRTTTDPAAPPPRPKRKMLPIALLVGVLAAGSVIVFQFLSSAVDYYCNVDEIGSRDGCEADRRLRVQGTVEQGSIVAEGGVTRFVIAYNGAELPVDYDGAPGGIFKECVPVVVHGRLVAGVFEGDRVEVKHSEEYEAANPDRIEQASATCPEAAP